MNQLIPDPNLIYARLGHSALTCRQVGNKVVIADISSVTELDKTEYVMWTVLMCCREPNATVGPLGKILLAGGKI